MATRRCHVCQAELGPERRGRCCARCTYWRSKAEALRIAIRTLPEEEKQKGGFEVALLRYRLRVATRVLQEFRWRESGRSAQDVHANRLRGVVYALAAACRSSVDEG